MRASCKDGPHMIVLFTLTAFFVLGLFGTLGKLLFDDWRVRRSLRPLAAVIPSAQ
jgi:hypothetical protein